MATDLSAQYQFYMREWRRSGKPIFDNVDVSRLDLYILSNFPELQKRFSREEMHELVDDFECLSSAEREWRSLGKIQLNLTYYCTKNEMPECVREYYERNPRKWYPIMLENALIDTAEMIQKHLPEFIDKIVAKLNPIPYLRLLLPSRRRELAEDFLTKGVAEWKEDNRFSDDKIANVARAGLIESDIRNNKYMADFGAHLSIWMLGKAATIVLMTIGLIALHIIGHDLSHTEKWWIGFAVVWGDSSARFVYSVVRGLVDRLAGKPFPWVAVIFAPIKWIGYFSYPLQMIVSARGEHESEFLVYLICAFLAKKVPIIGNDPNSGAAYQMNRLGWSLIKAPIWVLLTWCYSILTSTLLVLMFITLHSPVSMAGFILAFSIGLFAWRRINQHV